ncbi:MAG TPA: bifunctional DNA-formamidopyrimidine glycosylase/DNA-(apurinic or apyrimidinic site) lyase [Polyangiaceae bacterium]|nr:bifunctional DNA-formamidopyrimidine glycosylase/DNA-(apurinic or apyrimidinic site) lyase [Polyangiaceae bacterium]
MPELPEVEVTRRLLRPKVVGRRIASVVCGPPSYFFLTPPKRLERSLVGEPVTALERQGKYLLMGLGEGRRLLLHLGMTGQLFIAGARSPRLVRRIERDAPAPAPDPHTHLVLEFEDGEPGLRFRDVRKFGKVRLLAPGESDSRLEKLGRDALSVDGELLFEASRRRKVPIKTLLLDQGVLAGVGNIYADEALFLAGVRPTRPAQRVTREQCDRLAQHVRAVLERSIEAGGSSISDFIAPDGRDGEFQLERRVYAREGEPCSTCGTAIRRVIIGARSSHYCPRCQK